LRKKVVNNTDYKEVLADIIELKGFSEEAENLLLNMLYKIDENYDNYARVKREVPSKDDFIQKIIYNIRNNVKNVNFVRPHTQNMTIYRNNLLKVEQKAPEHTGENSDATVNRLKKSNTKTYDLECLTSEKSALYEISKIGSLPINSKLPNKEKAVLTVITLGRCISDAELVRDFTGWAWARDSLEIESQQCNIIYTLLIFLLGEKFVNSVTDVNQIKDVVSKEFYDLLEKACNEFYTATNPGMIDNYLSKIESLRNEMNDMKEQVKNQEEIVRQKKACYKELKNIDIALNDTNELRVDFIATNNSLPKGKKFYSISDYVDFIENKKKTLLRDVNRLNKLQDPTEFMKMQDDLLMKIKFYEEKTTIPELAKAFTELYDQRVTKARTRKDILDIIYEIRYLNFLPCCKFKLKTIARKAIAKGIKMGVINPVSNVDELDYRILRGIFETENSNLESLSIEVNKEFNSLQIQMFDGEVHDKTYYADTPRDSEIEVRKVKKYKIFA